MLESDIQLKLDEIAACFRQAMAGYLYQPSTLDLYEELRDSYLEALRQLLPEENSVEIIADGDTDAIRARITIPTSLVTYGE